MKTRFTIVLVLFFYAFTASAQINDSFKRFLDSIEIVVEEYDAIGISIAVIAGDEKWSGAAGVSSIQDSLNTDHVLALGSITKPMVSACILGLMEEGRLSLSDPIHTYLNSREHIDSTILIKELLYHTSGIYNYTNNPTFFDVILQQDQRLYTAEEVLDGFLLPPSFPRGERQEYSNTNYLLLGMIIEQIVGRPYYEEIIDRFNLVQNYPTLTVAPFVTSPTSMAHVWIENNDVDVDLQAAGLTLNSIFSSASSAGAFVATPKDLAKFGKDLLSGRLLTQAAMDSFYNYHPFLLSGQLEYGLGISSGETYCGVTSVGHSGGIIYTSDLQYVREYDLTVVVMTNDGNGIPQLGGVAGISQEIICQYQTSLTSVEELTSESSIQVFPNPFDDYVTINFKTETNGKLQLKLIDDMGRHSEVKKIIKM